MAEDKIDAAIVETVQRMVFYQVINSHIEAFMLDIRYMLYPICIIRKQHNPGKIRNQ